MPPIPAISDFVYWTGLVAVAVNAVAGALESGRKGMDIVGISVVALATALGGGTVRDVLLARPVFWIADPAYVFVAFASALLTFVLARAIPLSDRLFLLPDAFGLALFAIAGTQIALDGHAPWLVASLMGVVTATFGGVLRDVFCNEIPLIFLPGELYASAALAGSLACIGLQAAGLDAVAAGWAGMVVVLALRLAGMTWKIRVPAFRARPSRGEADGRRADPDTR